MDNLEKDLDKEEQLSFFKRIYNKYFGYEEFLDDDFDDDHEEYTNEEENNENIGDMGKEQEQFNSLEVNLLDCDDKYILYAVVPGLSSENIAVEITHEEVSINIEIDSMHSKKQGVFIYKELSAGKFKRTIILPAEIDVDNYTANLKNGVLELTVYKINKKRKIKLNIGK